MPVMDLSPYRDKANQNIHAPHKKLLFLISITKCHLVARFKLCPGELSSGELLMSSSYCKVSLQTTLPLPKAIKEFLPSVNSVRNKCFPNILLYVNALFSFHDIVLYPAHGVMCSAVMVRNRASSPGHYGGGEN